MLKIKFSQDIFHIFKIHRLGKTHICQTVVIFHSFHYMFEKNAIHILQTIKKGKSR